MCPEPVPIGLRRVFFWHRQAGLGLPVAIFLLLVLAMLAVAINELSALSAQTAVLQIQSQRAALAAESALEAASALLKPPNLPIQDCGLVPATIAYTTNGLRGCSATLSCRVDSLPTFDVFTLDSIATCGSGSEQAIQRAQRRLR